MKPVSDLGNEDENSLVKEALLGNLDAFNHLVLTYQSLAYRSAYSLTGDADLADDITQESFLKAFTNMNRFHGESFRAWLLKIVKNTAYDYLRRLRRHPTQSLSVQDGQGDEIDSYHWLVDPDGSVEKTVELNEDVEILYSKLAELPDIFRSVIMLVDLNDLSYAEVSEILDVPLGTVKSRLARARLQLMRRLQNELELHSKILVE